MQQGFTAKLNPGVPVPGPKGDPGPQGPPGVQISRQTDVSTSRNPNTVYQNPSATVPLFVSTIWNMNRNDTLAVMSDGNDPPTTMVAQADDPSLGSIIQQLFFIVLPGYFYRCQITAGAPTLANWIEYQ